MIKDTCLTVVYGVGLTVCTVIGLIMLSTLDNNSFAAVKHAIKIITLS